MSGRNGQSLKNIIAGIAIEVGFSMGLTMSLCLLAYLVAALAR